MIERTPTDAADGSRISALDGLRGIAILAVLVHHYYQAFLPGTDNWLDRNSLRIAGIGWAGVDLFFVLSGFLITGILLDARAGGGSYFKAFYARRFLRIFPAYYLFLFVLFFVLPNVGSLRDRADLHAIVNDQIWFWTYTNNINSSIHLNVQYGAFVNGHLWSLAVEEQFYLFWPLVVLLAGRRGLAPVCLVLIAFAFLTRVAIREQWLPVFNNNIAAYAMTPARLDSLAIGALVALMMRDERAFALLRRMIVPAAAIALAVLAMLMISFGAVTLPAFDYWTTTVGLSMLALLFGALVAATVTALPGTLLHRIGTQPVLTLFGKYSYATYIVHYQLLDLLRHRIFESGGLPLVFGMEWPMRLFFTFIGASMSLAVAWLSWQLYEQHFLKLKRFFPYRRGATPPAPQPAPAASSAQPAFEAPAAQLGEPATAEIPIR
jgi:peptidoglycan/LPS O-acetylase OafA/YrhL